MALQTANQYGLGIDGVGLSNRLLKIMQANKVDAATAQAAKAEALQQNLKTTGAQLFHIRNNIKGIDAQKKAIAEVGKAAAERGEDISVYQSLLDIDDPDTLNTNLMQKVIRAESYLKKGEPGIRPETTSLAKDTKLVNSSTGETIAENTVEELPGHKFVKDIPIGGGQYRAGYVSDDPEVEPIYMSDPYEKKSLIAQTINTGGNLPANYRWINPDDHSQGVTPIEGGPADPSVKQQNQYDEAISVVDKAGASLDRYEAMFDKHGTTVLPTAAKQLLGGAYASMQLEIKELERLGVLAGPDMQLIERVLTDPLSIEGKAYEFFGGKEGFKGQIDLVRQKINTARATAERLYGKGTTKPAEEPPPEESAPTGPVERTEFVDQPDGSVKEYRKIGGVWYGVE